MFYTTSDNNCGSYPVFVFYFTIKLKAYFRQNQIFTSIHVHVYYHNIHFRSQQMSLREEYYVNRVIVTKGQRI